MRRNRLLALTLGLALLCSCTPKPAEPTPTPVENGEPVPGGAQTKGGDTQAKEEGKPAHYDLLPLDE